MYESTIENNKTVIIDMGAIIVHAFDDDFIKEYSMIIFWYNSAGILILSEIK